MNKNKIIEPQYTPEYSEDIIQDYYVEKPLTSGEAEELAENLEKKIKANKKSVFKILNHLKALKNYMLDKDIKWYRKSVVVAALLYFIAPVDAMPDFAPLIGFLDDIGVIAWTIKFLGDEIRSYYS
ncbi:MAG: DUF1232 domain-containing protein [Chlorobi bacterium]|nr:DUF1232 domain-containing protein [Chlorobiota bacterium]MCI0716687.1 DUF1232 domain-containing protein [Chlorobiota bacterium]